MLKAEYRQFILQDELGLVRFCDCESYLNLDYGTYYYEDGGRRKNVVEVFFYHHIFLKLNPCLPQARDQNPEYDDYDYMESNMHNAIRDNNPQYAVC